MKPDNEWSNAFRRLALNTEDPAEVERRIRRRANDIDLARFRVECAERGAQHIDALNIAREALRDARGRK